MNDEEFGAHFDDEIDPEKNIRIKNNSNLQKAPSIQDIIDDQDYESTVLVNLNKCVV